MFKTFGKTLLVLIATMMVADPVMACCFPTSLELAASTEVSASQADNPPCHGSKTLSNEKPEPVSSDCPGCGNCASMIAAAEHLEIFVLASPTFDFELAAVNVTNTDSIVSQTSAVPIIPSGLQPRIVATPVTLKLKLHI